EETVDPTGNGIARPIVTLVDDRVKIHLEASTSMDEIKVCTADHLPQPVHRHPQPVHRLSSYRSPPSTCPPPSLFDFLLSQYFESAGPTSSFYTYNTHASRIAL
ncbi:hypothetical protein L1887_06767, partial [Cichorium endivia]